MRKFFKKLVASVIPGDPSVIPGDPSVIPGEDPGSKPDSCLRRNDRKMQGPCHPGRPFCHPGQGPGIFSFSNTNGFTLTEVLIGMMILTVAIVTGTNLLVGLIGSNKLAVSSLQAHYLAQEGLECVRHMRDTNWLHYQDWMSGEVYPMVEKNQEESNFELNLNPIVWGNLPVERDNPLNRAQIIAEMNSGKICEIGGSGKIYSGNSGNNPPNYLGPFSPNVSRDTGFIRKIYIEKYSECDDPTTDCPNYKTVRSEVSWEEGGETQSVELSTILTNWQGVAS